MPGLGPVRRRAHVQQVMMIAIGDHARPPKDKAAARDMIARRLLLFRTAAHLITVLSVSLSVRKARCGSGLGSSNSLAQVLQLVIFRFKRAEQVGQRIRFGSIIAATVR
jgi:hypothetical protein